MGCDPFIHCLGVQSGVLDTAALLKQHFAGRVAEPKLDSLGH
jgi:hypothetical protein